MASWSQHSKSPLQSQELDHFNSVQIQMSVSTNKRYLTKSRFKMALECPTKLHYSVESNGYYDKNQHNDFLQALADGGNQVGELAKFKYHSDPIGQNITIEPLEYELALEQTRAKLSQPERVVIAEAALLYAPFFVRVDILIQDKDAKTIDLIEVKSKSVTDATVTARFKNRSNRFESGWLPYLYDVTFQAEVARLNFPGFEIRTKLLLLDASKSCEKDGLHQLFQIAEHLDPLTGRSRAQIKVPSNLSIAEIGQIDFLREIDVSDIVEELRHSPIDNAAHIPESFRKNLATFMEWSGQLQMSGDFAFQGVSKACRSCQFRAPSGEKKLSGVHNCWKQAFSQGLIHGAGDLNDRTVPLSIDLWGGGAGSRSFADLVLEKGRAFLSDIQEEDIQPRNMYEGLGLSALTRRMAQVHSAAGQGQPFVIDHERLSEMGDWLWPLHMIDFETSSPALPFFKGMRPYETLAFQFSHHIMEKDEGGNIRIRHANQWIATEANYFPSIEFVRQLRKALMPTGELFGTVFRYHNHENTVLRNLRQRIDHTASSEVPDRQELMDFIDLITKSTGDEEKLIGKYVGAKPMVDLHRLVQEAYYSQKAGGSISLKAILPAILNDVDEVASMYLRSGVYGKGLHIESLNFGSSNGHVWLQAEKGYDPYKTLPAIFGTEHGKLNEMLARLAGDDDEDGVINQGGLAMTAYNYTQFNSISSSERKSIEQALLRYCELDTLAMVMVVQGLYALQKLIIKN
jgi:hypothetical protein